MARRSTRTRSHRGTVIAWSVAIAAGFVWGWPVLVAWCCFAYLARPRLGLPNRKQVRR